VPRPRVVRLVFCRWSGSPAQILWPIVFGTIDEESYREHQRPWPQAKLYPSWVTSLTSPSMKS
jgi:hypothetical protein